MSCCRPGKSMDTENRALLALKEAPDYIICEENIFTLMNTVREVLMMRQVMVPDRVIFHAGDLVTFQLEEVGPRRGRAVLRTNLGRAAVRRAELIGHTESGRAVAGLDWHDLELHADGNGRYSLTLPLTEVGVFEAKCCFVPEGGGRIEWPESPNFRLKVGSASSVAGNTIYAAFVRQFGNNCQRSAAEAIPESVEALDQSGYTVIPPSGTFRDLIGRLDHIFDTLECRILQLLPIHPAPVQYGRMGRYGSPFAALDYFAVDPALAQFDVRATPLEQFGELVNAVHARDGRIFMDIPVNHTGWASRLQNEHPEYFVRKKDGEFVSPGAWGVTWADLCKLNYTEPAVHRLMAEVFLFWCRRGVDGFRCDAGYMLPEAAWNYIVARVRREFPDTVFLLEGLGGPARVQEALLGGSGLDWGYSELFQNYSRDQISGYFPYVETCSHRFGTLVNFAETHDNARLAAESPRFARLRFLVTALLAENGSFGFANGAEFFATEKIDVHGASALNWGASPNLVALIRRCNQLLADHPAFITGSRVELVQTGSGNVLAALRRSAEGKRLLILLNLDCRAVSPVHWPAGLTPERGVDLLTGRAMEFRREGNDLVFELAPGDGCCVSFEEEALPEFSGEPPRVLRQRADAMGYALRVARLGLQRAAMAGSPGEALRHDPEKFAEELGAAVTHWNEAFDPRRRVMIAPGDLLLVESSRKFRIRLRTGDFTCYAGSSIPGDDGRQIVLLEPPVPPQERETVLTLEMVSFGADGTSAVSSGTILLLPPGERRKIQMEVDAAAVRSSNRCAFAANSNGGMSLFPAAWGRLTSKYNAILAANADRRYPVDRHTMWTRLRGWIRVNGYSQVIDLESLTSFRATPENRARWEFALPCGQGCRVRFEVTFEGAVDGDAVRFMFRRLTRAAESELDDVTPMRLILRADVEDRINHQLTKAYTGPEQRFPAATRVREDGFDFAPAERNLMLRMSAGRFVSQPEWNYMVDLPLERYYGLEDKTDLFSPGYFEIDLAGGESVVLTGHVTAPESAAIEVRWPREDAFETAVEPEQLFLPAMRRFLVKRDAFSTVIAGYPWFLDWGRDTLIALRGLIRGGFRAESEAVIRQFASFERAGTIPNMIRGNDDANRDTSDAPLWLIVAVRDFVAAAGNDALLKADCGGRALLEVLRSIVAHYRRGTPNGIRMDEASGLIFSPAHFTWMDTNFPAGTPREGYPIEIQALWHAALTFLGETELAGRVRHSLETLYFRRNPSRCSDCLHAASGVGAAAAEADDHIRPNQLFALTLGAVTDPARRRAILDGCEELIVPGGIRSLADRPVEYLLPVWRDGVLLNDPAAPYRGFYRGPEDTARKVAYHNGTVWCWPFPSYCEALYLVHGEAARERALALLLSAAGYFESGVPGELPEVADGDAPHHAGGCPAQAWSGSEFFRVYELLRSGK